MPSARCDRISVLSKMLSADEQSGVNDCILIATTRMPYSPHAPVRLIKERAYNQQRAGASLRIILPRIGYEPGVSSNPLRGTRNLSARRLSRRYPINGDRPIRVDFSGTTLKKSPLTLPPKGRVINLTTLPLQRRSSSRRKEGEFQIPKSSTLWYGEQRFT